jgi:membrane dipeptidase
MGMDRPDLDLLRRAIDMHAHTHPALFRRPLDDAELARNALQYGMRGFVLKDHDSLTTGRAYYVNKMFDGVQAFGGIVLNRSVGGLNPHVVQAAIHEDMERAQLLYAKAIIIDATCPLASRGKYLDRWIAGGVTAIAPTVEALGGIESAMRNLGRWLRLVREDAGRLVLVQRAGDILEAKQTGRLGIVLHFQGTEPLGDDLDLVEVYHRLGVRMIQLTYNRRNRVGDGCEERTDTGLSHFGIRLIQELNRAGIVVDLSHTGYRTTMEAMEVSTAPVVFGHSNARAVCPSARNLTDDQIKAVATKGGVIGVNGFPAFVARTERPTLAQFIAHIDYIADLVGPRHVGLGLAGC